MPILLLQRRTLLSDGCAHSPLTLCDENGFIETEVNMNAITISIVAMVITAALAVIAPVTSHTQHESMASVAHATT